VSTSGRDTGIQFLGAFLERLDDAIDGRVVGGGHGRSGSGVWGLGIRAGLRGGDQAGDSGPGARGTRAEGHTIQIVAPERATEAAGIRTPLNTTGRTITPGRRRVDSPRSRPRPSPQSPDPALPTPTPIAARLGHALDRDGVGGVAHVHLLAARQSLTAWKAEVILVSSLLRPRPSPVVVMLHCTCSK